MKVSVIVPLYNKAPYVRRALDSITAQTFSEYEVIVVDDGSTDNGPAIAGEHESSRFRLIHQTNAGPGAARNAGIAHAKGELLAFLDADDEWEPEFLEHSVRLLEQFGPEVASVTSGYSDYPAGNSTAELWRKRGITDGVHRLQAGNAPFPVVHMLAYMSPCTTVARAEVVRRWGGFYDKNKCSYAEDAQLWLKVLLNERVAFSLRPLAHFHREASGLSKNLNGVRPIEPFLQDATEMEVACPAELRELLHSVLAIRAAKTACVLGYWGHWREARSLARQFTGITNWRLPYHLPASVCTTPLGPALGASWRVAQKVLSKAGTANGFSGNGHARTAVPPRTLKIVALVEATNVNAVARNVLEFHRGARALDEKESNAVELSLVTFDRGNNSAEFVKAARDAGVEIDVIPERHRFDRSVLPALRKIIEQRSPDIIVTHQVKSHFLMRMSGLFRKIPWVAFNHGYTTTDRKVLVYNRLDRWSLPKADRVITVCEAFTEGLTSNGVSHDRISVLHNSIAPQPRASANEAEAVRKHLGIESDEHVVLAVGRLSKEKAQLNLLRAFAGLRQTHSDLKTKLVIVGDGPERSHLQAVSDDEGVADRVVFSGHVTNVQPYYAIADVLANASHSEGSPYVLLEAMAAGVPIVATAVGGVPEILTDDETALLVPAGESRAMAEAIEKLLQDKELARYLSSNAAALATSRFSPEAYVRALVDLYRNVVSNRANQLQ